MVPAGYVEDHTSGLSTRNYESRRIVVKHRLCHDITPAQAQVVVCLGLSERAAQIDGQAAQTSAAAREKTRLLSQKRNRMLDAADKPLSIC
jgi:hypothetical protein